MTFYASWWKGDIKLHCYLVIAVPSPPLNVQIKRLTDDAAEVTWDPSDQSVSGRVLGYNVSYTPVTSGKQQPKPKVVFNLGFRELLSFVESSLLFFLFMLSFNATIVVIFYLYMCNHDHRMVCKFTYKQTCFGSDVRQYG